MSLRWQVVGDYKDATVSNRAASSCSEAFLVLLNGASEPSARRHSGDSSNEAKELSLVLVLRISGRPVLTTALSTEPGKTRRSSNTNAGSTPPSRALANCGSEVSAMRVPSSQPE